MKRNNMISSLVVGCVALGAAFGQVQAAPATADKPLQFYINVGVTQDDNLLRLAGADEGRVLLGTSSLSDWYRFLGVGFDSLFALENQRFEFRGDVKHQTYDEFREFDHTAGRFRAAWNWRVSNATRGDLGYRFRRELRDFANQDLPRRDIITENAFFAFVEQQLQQRWMLRFGVDAADLEFSASPLLGKQRGSIEVELRYAASQSSTFGLLTTYTQSKFDDNSDQDFSGWSVGPSVRWRPRPTVTLTANAGYTHQGLDKSQPEVSDFDGFTGFAAVDWQQNATINWKLRAFRDISDLGGEIPLYTVRSGIALQPSWQITEKFASRAKLELQTRDFNRSSLIGIDREDDFLLAELWFDLTVARRWVISVGLGSEQRDSNLDSRDYDDLAVHATITFNR